MLKYLISFFIQVALLLIYFKIADKYNIIDKPNERSSHKNITIRGGGIVFPATALLWYFMYGYQHLWIIGALMLLAFISFLDDIVSVSSLTRIVVHFLTVTLLFWQLHIFEFQWYVVLFAYILTIGWINAFNFMDGINGITGIYGLVALVTFLWLTQFNDFVSSSLLILLILSVMAFLAFNFRKRAKTFAGDIGSVSMAFLLAWFMILLITKTGRVEYILLFAVYGIDSTLTILFRLWKGENIFEAHRTHLYQYLSNELDWPHVLVSGLYGVVQASINVLTIILILNGIMTWTLFALILVSMVFVYLFLRYRTLALISPIK